MTITMKSIFIFLAIFAMVLPWHAECIGLKLKAAAAIETDAPLMEQIKNEAKNNAKGINDLMDKKALTEQNAKADQIDDQTDRKKINEAKNPAWTEQNAYERKQAKKARKQINEAYETDIEISNAMNPVNAYEAKKNAKPALTEQIEPALTEQYEPALTEQIEDTDIETDRH